MSAQWAILTARSTPWHALELIRSGSSDSHRCFKGAGGLLIALKNRLPAVAGYRQFADAGGLASFGASLADNHRRAAAYVDKILRGAKPSALPIEQPSKFELVVNLKTAKALGLTIPPSFLARADQAIE